MHPIIAKSRLSASVSRLEVVAPRIAEIRQPGQFVIVHRGPCAERIPLTIADADSPAGTIALVIQAVGKSTRDLVALEPGENIADVVGPLGKPTEMIDAGRALCIGGGVVRCRSPDRAGSASPARRSCYQHHRRPLPGVGHL
jgi:NAD(P)H-flavin reductase